SVPVVNGEISSRGIVDSTYHSETASTIATTMTPMRVRRIQRRASSATKTLTIGCTHRLIDRPDHLIGDGLTSGTIGMHPVNHARGAQNSVHRDELHVVMQGRRPDDR